MISSARWVLCEEAIGGVAMSPEQGSEEKAAEQAALCESNSAPAVVAQGEEGSYWVCPISAASAGRAWGCTMGNPSCGEAAMWGPAPLF